jgi:hypothetical protein
MGWDGNVTDYSGYTVKAIWQMIYLDDGTAMGRHIGAWNTQLTVLLDQQKALRAYATALDVKWPADQSKAAAAFIGYLNGLATVMEDAIQKAAATWVALGQIDQALQGARSQIQILQSKSGNTDAYVEAWPRIHPVRAAAEFWVDPATDTGWHAEYEGILNQQSRLEMQNADKAVFEVTHMLQPQATDARSPLTPITTNGGGSGGGSGGGFNIPKPDFRPPPVDVHDPGNSGDGPVLGGGVDPGMPGGGVSGGGPGTGAPPGVITGPGWGSTGIGSPTTGPASAFTVPVAGGGAFRAGVIGDGGSPGGMMPMAAPGGAVGRGAVGRPGASGPMGAAAGRGAVGSGQRKNRSSDPEDPFEVPEGGPGLIDAPEEPVDFDPTPGVIGLDR